MLVADGCAPIELTDKDVWAWQRRWREVLARGLYAATGKWVKHAMYRAIEPCSFVVLGAHGHSMFGFQWEGKPPEPRGVATAVTSRVPRGRESTQRARRARRAASRSNRLAVWVASQQTAA